MSKLAGLGMPMPLYTRRSLYVNQKHRHTERADRLIDLDCENSRHTDAKVHSASETAWKNVFVKCGTSYNTLRCR